MSAIAHKLLRASAGTGKTYQLVEAYLAAIEEGHRPSEIIAITFTRKAAGELRARIRRRLRGEGSGRAVCAELGTAPISNFHGLALQMLRGFGYAGGLSEGISILGESGREQLLFVESCEHAFFNGGRDVASAVEAVAPFLSVDSVLPGALWETFARAREDGISIRGAALMGQYDPQQIRDEITERLLDLRSRLEAGRDGQTEKGRAPIDHFLERTPPPPDASLEEWAACWKDAASRLSRRGKLGSIYSEEDKDLIKKQLDAPAAEALCKNLAPHLAVLIDAAWDSYRLAKARERCLDFGDLVTELVQLLDSDVEIHRSVRERFKVVLVDEAQDTNPLQRRMVRLLAGLEGAAADTREPARLFVVGDRKQAIYGFRGGDPRSFELFSEELRALGGEETVLDVSRRSGPELVKSINSLGLSLFAEAYEPLVPLTEETQASEKPDRPTMTWLELPEDGLKGLQAAVREAASVAAYLKARLEEESPGDFAILLKAIKYAPLFVSALAKQGIPAILGGGSGFYEQREVVDLVSFMAWLSDPTEQLAAAVALRSPIVGLSDAGLLTVFGSGAASLNALRRGELLESTACPPADLELLARLAALLPGQVASVAVLSAADLLTSLQATFDLRAVYLGLAGGEQRLANLDRLWEMAVAHDAAGGSAARFAWEQLRNLRNGYGEPLSAVPAAARRAVTISTIHKAKGLEYPVVLLADVRRRGRNDILPLRYAREAGLLFRPKQRGESVVSDRWRRAAESQKQGEAAELKRLLYVAITRASREVIFVGSAAPKSSKTGFGGLLDAWRESAEEHALLVRIPAPPAQVSAPAAERRSPTEESLAWADELLRAAAPPAVASGTRFALPVTALETFLQCSRRGFFVHDLKLPEPSFEDPRARWSPTEERDPPLDPLARGRLAHALLANLDRCAAVDQAASFIESELSFAGYDPADSRLAGLKRDLLAFMESELGQEILSLGSKARRHELPFQLALPAGRFVAVLHGQIDLLYLDEKGPVVLDFKHARAGAPGISAYELQLQSYALAVEKLCDEPGDIRARLVFLRDRGEPHDLIVTPDMRMELTTRVEKAVEELAAGRGRRDAWPGCAAEECERLACGYRPRCHART